MHHLVYTSATIHDWSTAELTAFLARWRARNAARGITGLLLYAEGRVLQVLEGEETAVQDLFSLISGDLRHYAVQKLADGPIGGRSFTGWNMGFATMPGTQLLEVVRSVMRARSGSTAGALVALDPLIVDMLHAFAQEAGVLA